MTTTIIKPKATITLPVCRSCKTNAPCTPCPNCRFDFCDTCIKAHDAARRFDVPSFDDLYAFVKGTYKHERFEGRNGAEWGKDYAQRIVQGYMCDLEEGGRSVISRHESNNGRGGWFDAMLELAD